MTFCAEFLGSAVSEFLLQTIFPKQPFSISSCCYKLHYGLHFPSCLSLYHHTVMNKLHFPCCLSGLEENFCPHGPYSCQNQASAFIMRDFFVFPKLALGHLHYCLTGVTSLIRFFIGHCSQSGLYLSDYIHRGVCGQKRKSLGVSLPCLIGSVKWNNKT